MGYIELLNGGRVRRADFVGVVQQDGQVYSNSMETDVHPFCKYV